MGAIVLIGFMGAGKTTIGRQLANNLKIPFYDLDEVFVERTQTSITDFFSTYGEDSFRNIEQQLLEKYLHCSCVLATGGGVVTSAYNRKLLLSHPTVVWLHASFDTLYQRITLIPSQRPLVQSKSQEQLEQLYLKRENFYEECATYLVDTTIEPEKMVVSIICEIQNSCNLNDLR